MGATKGNFSRDIFDRGKQHVRALVQQEKAYIDADQNDGSEALYEYIRNYIKSRLSGSSAFFQNAFNVVEASAPANNIEITEGDGYIDGNSAFLEAASDLVSSIATTSEKNLHAVSTALSALVLTDSSANYVVNDLAGRTIIPNLADGTAFTIASNTATTITVSSGDMTSVAEIGNSYLITLTTPSGSDRTDTVWLNMFLDEVDGDDDPTLLHLIGPVPGYKADLRVKARTVIFVREDATTFADYTDLDGRSHFLVKLATLSRLDADADVTTAMITDERGLVPQDSVYWKRVVNNDSELADALESSDDFFIRSGSYSLDPGSITIPSTPRNIYSAGRQHVTITLAGTDPLDFSGSQTGIITGTTLTDMKIVGAAGTTPHVLKGINGSLRLDVESVTAAITPIVDSNNLVDTNATIGANGTENFNNCRNLFMCKAIRGAFTGLRGFVDCFNLIFSSQVGGVVGEDFTNTFSVISEDGAEAAFKSILPSKTNPFSTLSTVAPPPPVNLDMLIGFGSGGLNASHVLIKSGLVAACQDTPIGTVPTKSKNGITGSDIQLDITTSGINGLDTGAEAADTFYFAYLLLDSTETLSPAGVLSLSSAEPDSTFLAGSGYDLFRHIGSCQNNVSSDLKEARNINGWTRYVDETAPVTTGVVGGIQAAFLIVGATPIGDGVVAIPSTARRGLYTSQILQTNVTTPGIFIEVFFGNPDFVSGTTGGVNLHGLLAGHFGPGAEDHGHRITIELDLDASQQFAFRTTSGVPANTTGPLIRIVGYFEDL